MALSERTRLTRIAARRAHVLPLTEMPETRRAAILAAVAAPEPPPKFVQFGIPDDPRPMARIPSRAWYEWHWERGLDPDSVRERLDPALRAAVIARDGYTCQLCGDEIDPKDLHIDHIKPYSKGGRSTLDNLQAAHSTCNIQKGAAYDGED